MSKAELVLKGAIKALCEKSLYDFVKHAWKHIEPSEFIEDEYIRVMCDYLEQLQSRDIKRLIINIPPRCGKSTISVVLYPVWCWLKNPSEKMLTGSYSQQLATRDTVKSRNLINSPWFKELWGERLTFSSDQNQKTYYTNTEKGERLSFSTGGTMTGQGGDQIIIDDPINAQDSNSETVREGVNQWMSETVSTRLNDPKTGTMLIVMQRLHQNDLSGFLLETSNWFHLCLPMKYEGQKRPYEWRTVDGERLSSRFDDNAITNLENELSRYGGAYAVEAQLQQRPVPREGGLIKYEWIGEYTTLPNVKRYSWSFDTAIKKGQMNDYSVGTLWAECETGYYLIDMWRAKVEYPELKKQIELLFAANKAQEILVEDKASGQQLIQDLRRSRNLPIIPMMPGKNMPSTKEERVALVSTYFEAGKVFFPKNKGFMKEVVSELVHFPNASHDDIIDSITQYLARRLNFVDRKIYRLY